MFQLWIKDKAAVGYLAFDLREVLASLGPDALAWMWTVSDADGGTLEAVGEGLSELGALARTEDRVSGSRLSQIAGSIEQVIWGEFRAYRDPQSAEPLVRVVAFDGSFFEVHSEDEALIERVRSSFKDTVLNSPQIP